MWTANEAGRNEEDFIIGYYTVTSGSGYYRRERGEKRDKLSSWRIIADGDLVRFSSGSLVYMLVSFPLPSRTTQADSSAFQLITLLFSE